jgi:hypothetical protein
MWQQLWAWYRGLPWPIQLMIALVVAAAVLTVLTR